MFTIRKSKPKSHLKSTTPPDAITIQMFFQHFNFKDSQKNSSTMNLSNNQFTFYHIKLLINNGRQRGGKVSIFRFCVICGKYAKLDLVRTSSNSRLRNRSVELPQ